MISTLVAGIFNPQVEQPPMDRFVKYIVHEIALFSVNLFMLVILVWLLIVVYGQSSIVTKLLRTGTSKSEKQ